MIIEKRARNAELRVCIYSRVSVIQMLTSKPGFL